MKLSISRDDLVAGLALVGRAVASRATLPALGGVQLTAEAPEGLTLRATDLELSLTRTAPAGDGGLGVRPHRARRRAPRRLGAVPPPHARRRGFPAPAGTRRRRGDA